MHMIRRQFDPYLDDINIFYIASSIDEVTFSMVLVQSLVSHLNVVFFTSIPMILREEVPILIKQLLS